MPKSLVLVQKNLIWKEVRKIFYFNYEYCYVQLMLTVVEFVFTQRWATENYVLLLLLESAASERNVCLSMVLSATFASNFASIPITFLKENNMPKFVIQINRNSVLLFYIANL